jgi:hypothetical protein
METYEKCLRCKGKEAVFSCMLCESFKFLCTRCDSYVHSLPSKKKHKRTAIVNETIKNTVDQFSKEGGAVLNRKGSGVNSPNNRMSVNNSASMSMRNSQDLMADRIEKKNENNNNNNNGTKTNSPRRRDWDYRFNLSPINKENTNLNFNTTKSVDEPNVLFNSNANLNNNNNFKSISSYDVNSYKQMECKNQYQYQNQPSILIKDENINTFKQNNINDNITCAYGNNISNYNDQPNTHTNSSTQYKSYAINNYSKEYLNEIKVKYILKIFNSQFMKRKNQNCYLKTIHFKIIWID